MAFHYVLTTVNNT